MEVTTFAFEGVCSYGVRRDSHFYTLFVVSRCKYNAIEYLKQRNSVIFLLFRMILNCKIMENAVIERLDCLIKQLDCNKSSFARELGMSQTSLATIFMRGKTLSTPLLEKIIQTFPQVNIEWLITGSGSMFKDDPDENIPLPALAQETRPRIPYTAAAGSLTHVMEGIVESQCEQIPVVGTFPTYDFSIFVKGDSMFPRFESGDEVACKKISDTHFIQWGKVHVLDTAQGIIMKRIYEDGDRIRCVSYNPEYPDFSIPKEEIFSINLVVGLLRV